MGFIVSYVASDIYELENELMKWIQKLPSYVNITTKLASLIKEYFFQLKFHGPVLSNRAYLVVGKSGRRERGAEIGRRLLGPMLFGRG